MTKLKERERKVNQGSRRRAWKNQAIRPSAHTQRKKEYRTGTEETVAREGRRRNAQMETKGKRIAERKSQGKTTEARKKETQGETKRKAEAVNEEDMNPKKKAELQRDSRELG